MTKQKRRPRTLYFVETTWRDGQVILGYSSQNRDVVRGTVVSGRRHPNMVRVRVVQFREVLR